MNEFNEEMSEYQVKDNWIVEEGIHSENKLGEDKVYRDYTRKTRIGKMFTKIRIVRTSLHILANI